MNCKQCGNEIGQEKRDDTLFCNQNCKQKHYKRRKKVQKEIEKLTRDIIQEQKVIEHYQTVIKNEEEKIKNSVEKVAIMLNSKAKRRNTLQYRLRLDNEELMHFIWDFSERNPDRFPRNLDILENGDDWEVDKLVGYYRKRFMNELEKLKKEISDLQKEYKTLRVVGIFKQKTETHRRAESVIEKSTMEIEQFQVRLKELKQIDLDRLPIIESKKTKRDNGRKRVSAVKAYTGSEIAKLSFHGVKLNGELGRFLGKLERNKCAIALTGNSGAGKSTFSYTLADGFLEKGLNVGYFSLESGFTQKFKTFASKHAGNINFQAFEEGTLNDIRTEAKNFDCLIIDSFSKISSKAADFEDLRQSFPDTYFIIIFQKTTDGKIRGGSSILFNSTATIDIQINEDAERLAVMKKSRYDTENFIYSISEDRVIKANKLPI